MGRRAVLRGLAGAGMGVAVAGWGTAAAAGEAAPGAVAAVLAWLKTLARADGGYAFTEDQEHSHLSATFAVVGCFQALDQPVPDREQVAAFLRSHHPRDVRKLEQEHRVFDFQQVQALVWLGEDVAGFRPLVEGWKKPVAYMKAYERDGNPVLQSELGAIRCRELLGLPMEEVRTVYGEYLEARRRPDGTFNNTPAAAGGGGHVMNTWWALRALQALGMHLPKEAHRESLIAWLRACQMPGGGFTYAPRPEFAGVEDVAYTWAAVRALHLLGSKPAAVPACVDWLAGLAQADGGFADRPGWLSNPMAAFYALDALDLLGALKALKTPAEQAGGVAAQAAASATSPLPEGLKVFTIQIEAHGKGSPAEAVDLARSLKIHLWGAKNAEPAWMARAQAVADAQGVPVRFFAANEEYGTWVKVPGLGTYSHTSDIVAPTTEAAGPTLADAGVVTWADFRTQRLAPLEQGRGRLVWQFGENEELVRLFLDDSVERGGYAAISTFHFGNPDFTHSEPFLHRWRGKIPYVAMLDAHGQEAWWWSDVTTGCRTLFLAAEPTWEGWLQALKNNWVAAVRHDAASGGKTWMHTGSRAVREFVKAREMEWRWWENPAVQRPLVSLVLVRPGEAYEAGAPTVAVADGGGPVLRVRCAWQCTPQGALKQPITELVKLELDGQEVPATLVTKPRGKGLLDDHYHLVQGAVLTPGKHVATAHLRVVETGKAASRAVEFVV